MLRWGQAKGIFCELSTLAKYFEYLLKQYRKYFLFECRNIYEHIIFL